MNHATAEGNEIQTSSRSNSEKYISSKKQHEAAGAGDEKRSPKNTQCENDTDEGQASPSTGQKKRPNTGSGGGQQILQSFKRAQQANNPGSAAVLKPKERIATSDLQENGAALQRNTGQSENQFGKVVKMSRKSTIDTKDAKTGQMVVVLDRKQGSGSQKKQELPANITPKNHPAALQQSQGTVSPTTQL